MDGTRFGMDEDLMPWQVLIACWCTCTSKTANQFACNNWCDGPYLYIGGMQQQENIVCAIKLHRWKALNPNNTVSLECLLWSKLITLNFRKTMDATAELAKFCKTDVIGQLLVLDTGHWRFNVAVHGLL
eukprot:365208-Chlamydomonas_euryale.AAC.9